MRYTCVIIEDNPQELTSLESKLKLYFPEIHVLETFNGVQEFRVKIQNIVPQIIFFDTLLLNPINERTLRDLTQNSYLILMSSHVENLSKALSHDVFDFLLKPIERNELSRVIRKILCQENQMLREKLHSLSYLNQIDATEKKVAIPSSDGIHLFSINSIISLNAERNYTRIHFSDRASLLTSKTLKSYEEILPRDTFLRVHQSYLLNLNKIKSYINRNGGYLLMEDGSTITISTRKKPEILEYLKGKTNFKQLELLDI